MSDMNNNSSTRSLIDKPTNDSGSMLYQDMFAQLNNFQTPEIQKQLLRASRNDSQTTTSSSSTSESESSDDEDEDDDDSGTPTTDEVSMSSDNDELLEAEQNEGKKTKQTQKPISLNKKPVVSLKITPTTSAKQSTPPPQSLPKTTTQQIKPTGPSPDRKSLTPPTNNNAKHQTTAFRAPTPNISLNNNGNHETLRKIQDLAEREKDLVKNIQEHATAKSIFNEEKKKFEAEKLEFEVMKTNVKNEYIAMLSVKETILNYRELQTISDAAINTSLETLKRKEADIEEQMKALVAMQEANAKKLEEKDVHADEDVMIVDNKNNKKNITETKKPAGSKKLIVDAAQMDVQQQQPPPQQSTERKLLNLNKSQLQSLVPKQTFDILDNLSYWGHQNVFQCFAYSTSSGMELEIKNVSDNNNIVFTMYVKDGYH